VEFTLLEVMVVIAAAAMIARPAKLKNNLRFIFEI
jgi:prepilin-type N-terminal cleavage/methylation domain-containing protein